MYYYILNWSPRKFLICGESGGTSRPVDLAERYRYYDLVAERE